jgi:heat shock protein HtpX
LCLIIDEAVPVSPLGLAILIFAPTVSFLAELGLSRTREYHADLAATRLTGNPLGLARALHKLEYRQRSMLAAILGLGVEIRLPEALRTHPPTRERVARLLELAAKAPPGRGPPSGATFSAQLPSVRGPYSRRDNVRWSVMMM